MGNLTTIALVVLLFVASDQIFHKGVVGQNTPPEPGYQCYNDCRTDQQEDCNPGCWCEPVSPNAPDGVCLWDGNPPPSACSSHDDCSNEDGVGHCFQLKGSAYGLCIPVGIKP